MTLDIVIKSQGKGDREERENYKENFKNPFNSTTQSSLQIQCYPYQITNGNFHITKIFYNLYRNTKNHT